MSQVYFVAEKDPAMERAINRARHSFRYFWRELAWEQHRIVPGLSLAAVKVPFSDPPEFGHREDDPTVEQMWLSSIEFDGNFITGTLLNEPRWLESINEGDQSQFPIDRISDWMYAIDGRVYGAYTVNLLRSQMSRGERAEHDAAWGLDFGDPNEIEVVPPEWLGKKPKPGFLMRLFGTGDDYTPLLDLETAEHPMAVNMADSLEEYLRQDPMNVYATDDNGWTMLHRQALAGTAIGVSILLDHGADPNARTSDGMTAMELARTLGWKRVIEVLVSHGAT